MAGHDARVSIRQGYGARTGTAGTGHSGLQKPVPKSTRFGGSAVIVLLASCTGVAILDLVLMAGALH
jgi:hypothetical protein